jgi:uncharacterized membrane protein
MNERLVTFCDGVFAIAITLLILELKIPPLEEMHSTSDVWHAVGKMWPSFFALTLSFIIILISWLGHHNFVKMIDKSSPQFQIANGFFLFTVIIIPFPTAFMAEYLNTPYAQPAIVVYCLNAVLHNLGWIAINSAAFKPVMLLKNEASTIAMRKSAKGSVYGFFMYSALAIMAWWFPYVALVLNAGTWVYWLFLSISLKEESL